MTLSDAEREALWEAVARSSTSGRGAAADMERAVARLLAAAFDMGVTSEREGYGYDGNPYRKESAGDAE